MHYFTPHLISTYWTLQFISIVQNDAFHATVKLVSMPFNKDCILVRNLYLINCIKVVKRISKLVF